MPHDDFERLGGDDGVDKPLGKATAKIVSTGVLGSGLPILYGLTHNDSCVLANFANDLMAGLAEHVGVTFDSVETGMIEIARKNVCDR